MKNTIHFALALSALVLGACGGSDTTANETNEPSGSGGEHGEHHEHGDHHGHMPAEVAALHEELAPVWHQEPGAGRGAAACAHVESFRTHTATIAAMAVPEGADPAEWSSATATMTSTVEALASECAAGGANADAVFDPYHTAFHGVMEAAGGEHHDEHGEHHDEDHDGAHDEHHDEDHDGAHDEHHDEDHDGESDEHHH